MHRSIGTINMSISISTIHSIGKYEYQYDALHCTNTLCFNQTYGREKLINMCKRLCVLSLTKRCQGTLQIHFKTLTTQSKQKQALKHFTCLEEERKHIYPHLILSTTSRNTTQNLHQRDDPVTLTLTPLKQVTSQHKARRYTSQYEARINTSQDKHRLE